MSKRISSTKLDATFFFLRTQEEKFQTISPFAIQDILLPNSTLNREEGRREVGGRDEEEEDEEEQVEEEEVEGEGEGD